MVDESGFILTLSNFDNVAEVEYPGAFHVGFMQESKERVDELHARLKAGGFDPEPPREFHGAWTFYFRESLSSTSGPDIMCRGGAHE